MLWAASPISMPNWGGTGGPDGAGAAAWAARAGSGAAAATTVRSSNSSTDFSTVLSFHSSVMRWVSSLAILNSPMVSPSRTFFCTPPALSLMMATAPLGNPITPYILGSAGMGGGGGGGAGGGGGSTVGFRSLENSIFWATSL